MEKERVIWVDDSQNAISMGFIEYLKLIEDPRQSFKTSHSLLEIIFISVCAYICGANSWDGVFEFAKTREAWLRKYIKLKMEFLLESLTIELLNHSILTLFKKASKSGPILLLVLQNTLPLMEKLYEALMIQTTQKGLWFSLVHGLQIGEFC